MASIGVEDVEILYH